MQKNDTFIFHLSPDLKSQMHRAAKNYGISTAEYCRTAVKNQLDRPLEVTPDRPDPKRVEVSKQITQNLEKNQ